ncbi:MAG TPA: hypothetical protein VKF42_03065 [Chitinivibrionales bacterium]|jgi:hypothetical protein|nr:hypothetical protein [Chitinivibrionales bacterium]
MNKEKKIVRTREYKDMIESSHRKNIFLVALVRTGQGRNTKLGKQQFAFVENSRWEFSCGIH